MNLHDAGYYILQAGEYREAAKMLSDMGHRRAALPLLAKADQFERMAKELRAKTPDHGPDFPVPRLPKPGPTAFACPRCGEALEFQPREPDVGLPDDTLGCLCGFWQKVKIDDGGREP